MLIRMR